MYKREYPPFFQRASFQVENPQSYQRIKPKIKSTLQDYELIAFSLAKAGYYGGSPETVYNTKTDTVMRNYHFEVGMNQYQETEMIINEKKD